MIEELRRVIAQVEQQPEDVQRHIAEMVRQELDHACQGQTSAVARTSYAGAWSHLPEDDELETLDRQRHVVPPTPPVDEQLQWLEDE